MTASIASAMQSSLIVCLISDPTPAEEALSDNALAAYSDHTPSAICRPSLGKRIFLCSQEC